MSSLDKGSRYQKNGLDFTLINKDYKVVGRIHYVQAKCNICGKKVQIHRGEWFSDNVKICPSCSKGKNAKQEADAKNSAGQRPVARIQPKETVSIQSQNDMFTKGGIVDNCTILDVQRDIVHLQCNKCKIQFPLNKVQIIGKARNKEHLCSCYEMDKTNVGLIKGVSTKETESKPAYRELPGWIFSRETVEGKQTRYVYRCATCGNESSFTSGSVLNNRHDCPTCKKMIKNKRVPLGNLDWIGYMTKCRRVEKVYVNDKGIKMATLKCLICGDTEDLALISVLKDTINPCSKCESKQLILSCPICGKNHLKNNLKGLYSGVNSDIICINKNKKIPKDELILEHDSRIRIQYITSKYRGRYKYKKRLEACEDRGQLFIFEDSYIGTDGEEYNSCMCVQHNKFLSLTEEEQTNYRHEYCTDIRMIPYNGKRALK